MSNFDATEIVVWVQNTVGSGINRLSGYVESGVLSMNVDEQWRKNMYLQATQFLTSDVPLDIEVRKMCVIQCMQHLESAARLIEQHSKMRAKVSQSPYWSDTDKAKKIVRDLKLKDAFSKMLNTEAEQILSSVQHILNLEPTAFKNKIENTRNSKDVRISVQPPKA